MNSSDIMPSGWAIASLADIGEIVSGGTPSTAVLEYWNGDINWISPVDLSGYTGKYISKGKKSITPLGLQKSSARLIPKGSVLFSSRAPIGYVAIASDELCTNQGFKSIIPNKMISNEYLYYFLKYAKKQAEDLASGTTFKEISLSNFAKIKIPVPPLAEQHYIVAKIDELFSSLDKGIESLKAAEQQLKIYRQSVLKWAFEGRFTKSNVRKYGIPKAWQLVCLKDICLDITDGDHQPPPKSNTGIPFITISNIDKSNNRILFENTFLVGQKYYERLLDKRKPRKGDVLFTVTGSFGIPVLVDFERPFCFQRHIALLRPLQVIDQKYLYYVLQTNDVYKQAEAKATGTAQKTVGLASLRDIQIPIASTIIEQKQIVSEIECRFSVCDQLEKRINQNLQQAETLRQSILKKAFEGKLVPYDYKNQPGLYPKIATHS